MLVIVVLCGIVDGVLIVVGVGGFVVLIYVYFNMILVV